MDASPSVFRELGEMKAAAQTLAERLASRDEVAVVSFAGSTHLLLPFTHDRAQLERTLTSAGLAQVENSRESNIYLAIYLTTRQLFRDPARRGRKAIVLLTDGQDSGLGLGWDPASAMPRPGVQANRLAFEDVARELAAAGVEVYAISTQPRPKAMTDAWLESHRSEMLVNRAARELGMPHYTVYLAELARRAGGRLYFLQEMGTLSAVYRRIAETLGAEYTLGYYPRTGLAKPGWRALRVELARPLDAQLTYRAAYYVPAAR
jgi:VWFA-related protein